jgi:hypothetical protein
MLYDSTDRRCREQSNRLQGNGSHLGFGKGMVREGAFHKHRVWEDEVLAPDGGDGCRTTCMYLHS